MAIALYSDVDFKGNEIQNATMDLDAGTNAVTNLRLDSLATGVLDTDLSTVSGSDDTVASAKAIKTYIDNRVWDNVSYREPVNLAFNDAGNSLPLTTATQIDSVTVTDGMRVLVLDSATAGEDLKIYQAAVSGVDITWTVKQDGTGADLPTDGNTVWIKSGTVYADQRWTYNGTAWVQTSGAGSIPDASTTVKGKVELAIESETNAKSSSVLAVTPASLTSYMRCYTGTITTSTGATVTQATHGISKVTYVSISVDDGTNLTQVGASNYVIKANQNVVWSVDTAAISGEIYIFGV